MIARGLSLLVVRTINGFSPLTGFRASRTPANPKEKDKDWEGVSVPLRGLGPVEL
jgi:hypothetical protein